MPSHLVTKYYENTCTLGLMYLNKQLVSNNSHQNMYSRNVVHLKDELHNNVDLFWKEHVHDLAWRNNLNWYSNHSQHWHKRVNLVAQLLGGLFSRNNFVVSSSACYNSGFLRRPQKIGKILPRNWRLLSKCQINWKISSYFYGLLRIPEL